MCEKLNVCHPSSGGWMEALLNDFTGSKQNELVLLTTNKQRDLCYLESSNIKYYVLPCGDISKLNHKTPKVTKYLMDIINKEKPDLLHIWGTEFTLGLAALKCGNNIPSVVYMQGIIDSIARYYEAGMSKTELAKAVSFRDIIKKDWISEQKNKFINKAKLEKQILDLSGNIISENQWCNAYCKSISPNIITHYCKLSIREEFNNYKWNLSNVRKHTVMCNASGYPIKGLHILIKALSLISHKYPQVKLLVPGAPQKHQSGLINIIKRTGYSRYIESLIMEHNLENNVEFLGILTADQMAENMAKTNVFVVPSSIENHSSTLKEAMIVGTPCISSYVGGVPEYLCHKQNGFLYRFEEYEMLAEHICEIFEDDRLAIKISDTARKTITESHKSENIYQTITNIYKDIVTAVVKN